MSPKRSTRLTLVTPPPDVEDPVGAFQAQPKEENLVDTFQA